MSFSWLSWLCSNQRQLLEPCSIHLLQAWKCRSETHWWQTAIPRKQNKKIWLKYSRFRSFTIFDIAWLRSSVIGSVVVDAFILLQIFFHPNLISMMTPNWTRRQKIMMNKTTTAFNLFHQVVGSRTESEHIFLNCLSCCSVNYYSRTIVLFCNLHNRNIVKLSFTSLHYGHQ